MNGPQCSLAKIYFRNTPSLFTIRSPRLYIMLVQIVLQLWPEPARLVLDPLRDLELEQIRPKCIHT